MAAITYKCPNCGGGLVFDPKAQTYKCEYCLSGFSLTELEALAGADGGTAQEAGTGQNAGIGQEAAGARLYHCPSCGAEIVTDETTAATFCYYCHNPVILEGRLDGSAQPDYVIPFAIGRKQAEEMFQQWIGKKRYVPSGFYSKKQIASMTGVYFPYWLYSCQVDGELEAEGVKLRMWDAGSLRYTERKTFEVSRRGTMSVRHMARNALKKANRMLAEGVLPFQMEGLQEFQMGYLSGFVAEKRDMEQQQFAAEVEQEVQNFAVSSLKNSAEGYSSLNVRRQRADIQDARWRYGLFPVWTLTYKGPKDGTIYYFAMNGQTGKICGKLPVDKRKLAVLFLTVFVPILAFLLIGGYFI
ncbi:MAG: TFIIB-type zinc ribbon-containing protein [Lachnospiraceae bacterium]|nr:TFIIB-type zinc ribbon-containing protein [Lachnospiraceae bacterium]